MDKVEQQQLLSWERKDLVERLNNQALNLKAEIQLTESSLVDGLDYRTAYEEFEVEYPMLNELCDLAMEAKDKACSRRFYSNARALGYSTLAVIGGAVTANVPLIIAGAVSLSLTLVNRKD